MRKQLNVYSSKCKKRLILLIENSEKKILSSLTSTIRFKDFNAGKKAINIKPIERLTV